VKVGKPTGKVNVKFWLEACPVGCVKHVKKLVIHGFKGTQNEHAFIKFVQERAQALETMVVVLCLESFSPTNCHAKMKPFRTVKFASKDIKAITFVFPTSLNPWSFRMATDVSCRDPFDRASAV
jgi:hypothetical protein